MILTPNKNKRKIDDLLRKREYIVDRIEESRKELLRETEGGWGTHAEKENIEKWKKRLSKVDREIDKLFSVYDNLSDY